MSGNNNDFKVIETLTKSAEILLRRIIKFLVGKISLVKLQELIRSIYVEEAENLLKSENPRKNVALTKLALLTGLDTRTLTRVRNRVNYRKPAHEKSFFMSEVTPVASLIDNWSSMDEFTDSHTGLPKTLHLKGQTDSFERLFSVTIKSRGVTPQSILDRLGDNGAIRYDNESQTVELLKTSYLPTRTAEQLGSFEAGFTAAANLLDTIVHNFETSSPEEKFFQRGAWSFKLPLERRQEFQEALTEILLSAYSESYSYLETVEERSHNPNHITVGVSMFYFENDVPDEEG